MRTAPWMPSNGLPWEVVTIVGIDGEMAEVENHIGKTRRIPVAANRAKGAYPAEGERWVIDKQLGDWTFAAVLYRVPVTVTGDRSDGTALVNLLAALEGMGLIIDETTA